MSILVTGGAGFIGSHTCVELLNAGYDVVVVDNLYNASEKALDRVKEITGKDLTFYKADIRDKEAMNEVFEKRCPVGVLKKLGFGKCRLSLAIPQDIDYPGKQWFSGKKIATSYPGILSDYLHRNDLDADIHVITGSVEIAPGIRLADAIFDIVSSGSTLVSNRLKEVERVVESEAVLIGSDSMTEAKREILDELMFRFDSVQVADDKKYILMNVPQDKLDEVLSVLPGIKSPTVMPLADKSWCSVHTVLDEKCFWEIINRLKAAGAEGILVLDIEKMIL